MISEQRTDGSGDVPIGAEHPNVATLRAIYADLTTIARYTDDDVVLHAAERELPGTASSCVGAEAVSAKEQALIELTGGTLVMDVSQIIANDHFGAVTGHLRACLDGREIAMPFCGLWRFRDGRVIEHWENAYDVRAFGDFLAGNAMAAAPWLVPAS